MTNYRKMRRQARLARRGGLQPMMVISTGDEFPETVGVLVARWAWRYRSELAPLGVTAALMAAAWWLHRTRPHWWASGIHLPAADQRFSLCLWPWPAALRLAARVRAAPCGCRAVACRRACGPHARDSRGLPGVSGEERPVLGDYAVPHRCKPTQDWSALQCRRIRAGTTTCP